MKTLKITPKAGPLAPVLVKCDIFASVAEMRVAGFDTRFTAMEIEDTDLAISVGININELDYSYASIVSMIDSIGGGLELSVFDLNDSNAVISKEAQVDNVTLSGTSGAADVLLNAVGYTATFNTDLATTADDFVTTHTAALSAVGVDVTHPGADGVLVFTASNRGEGFYIESALNSSGDLAGVVSNVEFNEPGTGEVVLVGAAPRG